MPVASQNEEQDSNLLASRSPMKHQAKLDSEVTASQTAQSELEMVNRTTNDALETFPTTNQVVSESEQWHL